MKNIIKFMTNTQGSAVSEKNPVLGLFKNVQMQGAQKAEPRSVYGNTLSGAL
jgi:hypothetical protein